MAVYTGLFRFTEQGARNIKRSVERAHKFDEAAEKAGVIIEGQYWTLGPYDGVLIISADEPKKGAHCLAELASFGNVSVQTLTAFKDTKIAEIMET